MDDLLLETAAARPVPLLRLYAWTAPAASFGYFQRVKEVEATTPLRPLVRRPTAGGVVPHDCDWTYSLTFPPSHEWWGWRACESYRRLHLWIQASLECFKMPTELARERDKTDPLQCFAGPDPLDVVAQGSKVAGAAQRRNKRGLLIQGSVQLPGSPDRARWEHSLLDAAKRQWGVGFNAWAPPRDWGRQVRVRTSETFGNEAFLRRR